MIRHKTITTAAVAVILAALALVEARAGDIAPLAYLPAVVGHEVGPVATPTLSLQPSPSTTPTTTPTPTLTATPTATPTQPPTATPTATQTNTPKPTNTAKPTNTPKPTQTPKPTNTPRPTATATRSGNCDPAYPTVCIPPPPPDLDCPDIEYRNFTVLPPDPHGFDGNDNDGIGCET